MTSRALLLVTMEPPASLEEEFNDWYDLEHFPQRSAIPGFESASRWVCLDGWPRWLALYDLTSTAALESDAYLSVSGPRSTPWSRRILPRTIGRTRVIAQAFEPQDSLQHDPENSACLAWLGFAIQNQDEAAGIIRGIRDVWGTHPDLSQLRSFVSQDDAGHITKLWVFATFASAMSVVELRALLGRPAGRAPSTFNLYAPYWRNP
jgi:hypothetical protein